MNITVKIDAQEVAQAIHALAQAINNNLSSSFKALADAQQEAQTQQPVPTQQLVQQPVQQVPTQQPAPTQQPVQTQPVQQQQVQTQPVQQQQVQTQPAPTQQPVQQVPTAQQTYTIDELGKASALLMDAGKQQDLVNLLGQFGVQALTQLPKEQYGAFATALRGLGAQI